MSVRWTGEPVSERDVCERPFTLTVDDHDVPGILWTPADAAGTRPLVLACHGGSQEKRTPHVLSMARRMARHHGTAVVSIDNPGHGERGTTVAAADLDPEEAAQRSRTALKDWAATLEAVQQLDQVGQGPLGWYGLSMGTAYGVPFVGRESRMQVAVLGLFGSAGRWAERYDELAGRIDVPLLFLVQLQDELVATDAAVRLFNAFASTDKRLHANPGKHVAVPREEMDAAEAFLARHLTG